MNIEKKCESLFGVSYIFLLLIPVPRQLVIVVVAVYARVVVEIRVVEICEDYGGKCTSMQLYHT